MEEEEEDADGKEFIINVVAKYFIETLLRPNKNEYQHVRGVGRRTVCCRVQEDTATPGWGRGGPRGGTMVPWQLVVKLSGAATPPPDPLPPSLPFLSAALPRKHGVWLASRSRAAVLVPAGGGQPPHLHAASTEG